MCRNIGLGCGVFAAIGIVLFLVLGAWAGALARRIAPALPETPVSVEGACPEAKVMAWVEGYPERDRATVALFDEADALAAESGTRDEPIDSIKALDIDALYAELDRLTTAEVPPCLSDLRDAEAYWRGVGIRGFEVGQVGRGPARLINMAGVMLGFRRGWGPGKERMAVGFAKLGDRLDRDLSASVPYPDASPSP